MKRSRFGEEQVIRCPADDCTQSPRGAQRGRRLVRARRTRSAGVGRARFSPWTGRRCDMSADAATMRSCGGRSGRWRPSGGSRPRRSCRRSAGAASSGLWARAVRWFFRALRTGAGASTPAVVVRTDGATWLAVWRLSRLPSLPRAGVRRRVHPGMPRAGSGHLGLPRPRGARNPRRDRPEGQPGPVVSDNGTVLSSIAIL